MDAYDKALSYFEFKRGLENDFNFPGKLLDDLSESKRKEIEDRIVRACLNGDSRFFGALCDVKSVDLKKIFNQSSMNNISDPRKRVYLLGILFQAVRDPAYLQNTIMLAPAGYKSNMSQVFEQDWFINDLIESNEYDTFLAAWGSLVTTSGCIGRPVRIDMPIKTLREKDRLLPHKLLDKRKSLSLSEEHLDKFIRMECWQFRGDKEYRLYWNALSCRFNYLNHGDIFKLQYILENSLSHPEVYSVLHYMYRNSEVDFRAYSQAAHIVGVRERFFDY